MTIARIVDLVVARIVTARIVAHIIVARIVVARNFIVIVALIAAGSMRCRNTSRYSAPIDFHPAIHFVEEATRVLIVTS